MTWASAATSVPCGQVVGPNGLIAAITQANAASTPPAIHLAKCVYELDGVAATSSVTLSGGLSDTLGGAIWNVATLCGGALYFEGGGSADGSACVMIDNRAGRSGGAIFAAPARLDLASSVPTSRFRGGIFAAGDVIAGNHAGNCAPTGRVPACSG